VVCGWRGALTLDSGRDTGYLCSCPSGTQVIFQKTLPHTLHPVSLSKWPLSREPLTFLALLSSPMGIILCGAGTRPSALLISQLHPRWVSTARGGRSLEEAPCSPCDVGPTLRLPQSPMSPSVPRSAPARCEIQMGLFPQTGRFLPRIRCRAVLASRSVCGEDRGRPPGAVPVHGQSGGGLHPPLG